MENKGRFKAARELTLHRLFKLGIWVKLFDGILEFAAGLLFLTLTPQMLNHSVIILTQHELTEDPGDLIANALRHAASHLSSESKLIAALYLLGNGIVKIFLATGILRGKLWCYPTAIVVMTIFVVLQVARLIYKFSIPMLIATLVNVAIILLIWREYRHVRSHPENVS